MKKGPNSRTYASKVLPFNGPDVNSTYLSVDFYLIGPRYSVESLYASQVQIPKQPFNNHKQSYATPHIPFTGPYLITCFELEIPFGQLPPATSYYLQAILC